MGSETHSCVNNIFPLQFTALIEPENILVIVVCIVVVSQKLTAVSGDGEEKLKFDLGGSCYYYF